ncbi:MAG: hypothetical protein ACXAB4_13650 [Candidatus Hodarchaeales archaeon]|jgi:hypothetical protein
MQDISFFRASIGIILAPAPESASFFIKMTRKTKNGSFEKFSKGEGRIIALSLQEISQSIISISQSKEFTAFHRSPAGVETRIGFLPKPSDQLEIRLEDYIITLNPAEQRIFGKLLEKTEDAILHQIVMKKLRRMSQEGTAPVSPTKPEPVAASEANAAVTQETTEVDPALLSMIQETFQGGWILSKILDKLEDLGKDVSRQEVLDSLELLLQQGIVTKEQRTAQAGHKYAVWRFPEG